ncbi:MAG: hypothetical protein ACTSPY_00055 [Candidatus Helarchaeota archaeon]
MSDTENEKVFEDNIAEEILANLNVVAIDGIDKKIAAKLKKVNIITIKDLVLADPFEIVKKVKYPLHKLMEFRKKAQYILELEFNEDIVNTLESQNFTIQQAIEEEPTLLKDLVKQDMYYIKDFLDNVVQVTIFLDAVTCRSNSVGILRKSKLEQELSREQILAKIYSSDLEKSILSLLQERSRSKRELQDMLADTLVHKKLNLHDVLDYFIRAEIVQQDWVKSDPDVHLFLIADFFLTRKPANNIIKSAKDDDPTPLVAKNYLDLSKNFFVSYEPTEEDNQIIAKNLLNSEIYSILKLLREKPYQLNKFPTSSDTENEGSTDIKTLISSLEKDGIVKIFRDEQDVDWVLLLTDITAEVFYPEYMIENIRIDHQKKLINNEIAIKHLDLLEHIYDTFYKIF